MRRTRTLSTALSLALVLAGCGDSDDSSTTVPPGPPISVFAPPTIAPVVDELAQKFEADNPGTTVNVVRRPANQLTNIAKTAKAGLAVLLDSWLPTGSQALGSGSFGRNLAVIAVQEGNPRKVSSASAFADEKLRTVVCGTASFSLMATVVKRAGIAPPKYTLGPSCATDAVAQVDEGNVDAALIFRNNVVLPDGVELVDIPDTKNVVFDFSFVVMGSSPAERSFGDFLSSDAAKDILTAYGYLP